MFAAQIYVRAWLTAPIAVSAPNNNLQLLQQLVTYPDPAIAKASSSKIANHLWHLSEEVVGLVLFAPAVSAVTKIEMVAVMCNEAW